MMSCSREERRSIFYPKTDAPVDDAMLARLKSANPDAARARNTVIRECLSDLLGETPETVSPMEAQGTYHLVHRAVIPGRGPVIVRSSVDGIFSRDFTLHLDAWAARSLAGVPVPDVLAVETGRENVPFDLMVSEQAPGTSLRDMDEDEIDSPTLLAALGEALARVHEHACAGAGLIDVAALAQGDEPVRGVHESWPDYVSLNLDGHIGDCVAAGTLGEEDGAEAARHFSELAHLFEGAAGVVLHGDPGNHNVFVEDGAVSALVDWEDALAGDPVFDVAMWATFHPPRRFAPFFEGYGLDTGDEATRLRLALYVLRITLSKAVHRRRFGYADAPGRPTMAQRLAGALEAVRRARAGKQEIFG